MEKLDKNTIDRPTHFSYKVDEHVWGGEYPRNLDETTSAAKLEQFRQFGITHFIDLTEEDELKPYKQMLWEGAVHYRFPVEDGGIPESTEAVRKLIAEIRHIIVDNPQAKIYIHCWGGVGRTAQILAAYISVTRNMDFDNTMFMLRLYFSRNPKAQRRVVPENYQQELFIRRFCEGK